MLEKDILASNIYALGYEYDSKANLDYTKKLIINQKIYTFKCIILSYKAFVLV